MGTSAQCVLAVKYSDVRVKLSIAPVCPRSRRGVTCCEAEGQTLRRMMIVSLRSDSKLVLELTKE